MANSILRDVKKVLALNPDDTDFDLDILMHINAVITILEDLGAGPIEGFSLVGNPESTWDDYFGNGKAYDIDSGFPTRENPSIGPLTSTSIF